VLPGYRKLVFFFKRRCRGPEVLCQVQFWSNTQQSEYIYIWVYVYYCTASQMKQQWKKISNYDDGVTSQKYGSSLPSIYHTNSLSMCTKVYIIYNRYIYIWIYLFLYVYIIYRRPRHIAHWRSTKSESENQTRVNFDLSREQCGAASAPIYYYIVSLNITYIYIYLFVCAYREPLDQKAKRRPYKAKNNTDCFFITCV